MATKQTLREALHIIRELADVGTREPSKEICRKIYAWAQIAADQVPKGRTKRSRKEDNREGK